VSDWAPVLTSLWVEYEDADGYALAELAQAEYETGIAAENVLRRKWELSVSASDRNVRRDGQVDAKTGRQAIAALWDAWELGTELDFKDLDHDADPVTYLVRIVGMEEKAAKPADGARWGESLVTLVLEEGEGLAAAAGGVHVHSLPDLDDVTIGMLVHGHVLTWDSATSQWINEEPGGGAHNHDANYQPLDGDLTALAGLAASPVKLQVTILLGDGTNVISTGIVPGDVYFDFPVTITEWTLTGDVAGSIAVDLWVDSYANFPPTVADTITAAAKPTISGATKGQSSTLTGWGTSIAADSLMRINVDSAATIKRAALTLSLSRV
jgi:hypothetical protein